ncbi:hypothetical protein [Paraburkholderia hospita]|uniref:hypothetical protein n=1 Tax=Paraburkholderia hospita TaxID=169430 RepID=UPI0010543AD2|nr:hypothetical protein [Paraburkholderia hospita]
MSLDDRLFIRSRGETHNDFLAGILRELKIFDFYGRFDLVRAVAEHPRLPTDLQPLYPAQKAFHGVVELGKTLSHRGYLSWIFGIFVRCKDQIRSFNLARTKIATQILKGKGVDALQTLAAVSDVTESWWGIETAIHINKELLGNDTKGHIKQLQEAYPNLNIENITHDLLLLSESSSPMLYIDTVKGRLKEYRSSGILDAILHGQAESCLLLPIFHDCGRNVDLLALHDYRSWSVFDQYMLFRSMTMELALGDNLLDSEVRSFITRFASQVNDWELCNILAPVNDVNPFVDEIVAEYTGGNYERVIAKINVALDEGSASVFGLLEIHARSKIYTNMIGSGSTFFDRIADEFAKILTLDLKEGERVDLLLKIAIKFRHDPWAKSFLYHLVALDEWSLEADPIEQSRLRTLGLGSLNTPKARMREFQFDLIQEQMPGKIPEYRLLRYSSNADGAYEVDRAIFPIYSDYLRTQSRFFLHAGKIREALRFCIDEFLHNKAAISYLPVKQLCEMAVNLNKDDRTDAVLCLIIFDVFGKELDGRFDESKTELFEKLLEDNGTFQPSKLFEVDEIDARVAYFYRQVCVPTQLDNIIEFSSYDEVIHERVAVIDLLIRAKIDNVEELRTEKDRVLETLFSEKLRAKIESGKLFVDIQALDSHRRHIYHGLFDQAKSLEGGVELHTLGKENKIDSDDLVRLNTKAAVAVASSEKSNILVRMFNQAVEDFALNGNYGLDKYLSAEVRHTVFVSQLRSCFEKTHLLTAQKGGVYLSNDYWTGKYNYVASGIVQELDELLASFSAAVDVILQKVNEQFRVNVLDLDSPYVFDFVPLQERVVRVSKIVESASTFDQFFSGLMGLMWELAADGARNAQRLIDEVLLAEVLQEIDILESEIMDLKGSVAMADLMQEIKTARSEFKSAVELVLNWFRFSGSEDNQTYEKFGTVVEAAVSAFQSMFKHKGRALVFTQSGSGLWLSYTEARALFISLFTALENSLRYGAPHIPVVIVHKVEETCDVLTICNEVHEEITDPQGLVHDCKRKWSDAYSDLSTAEGGSGLYKIFSLLRDASSGFKFDISIDKNQFNSMFTLRHEYFVN